MILWLKRKTLKKISELETVRLDASKYLPFELKLSNTNLNFRNGMLFVLIG